MAVAGADIQKTNGDAEIGTRGQPVMAMGGFPGAYGVTLSANSVAKSSVKLGRQNDFFPAHFEAGRLGPAGLAPDVPLSE